MVCSFFSSPRRFQRDRSGRAAHLPRLHPHHQATVQRGHSDHQGQWRGLIAGSTVYHRMIYTHTHTHRSMPSRPLSTLSSSPLKTTAPLPSRLRWPKSSRFASHASPLPFRSLLLFLSLGRIFIYSERNALPLISLSFVHSRCSMIMYAEQHKA